MSTSREAPPGSGETDTDVLIVGAGPTGLMSGLALRYPLSGPAHPLPGARAPGMVHPLLGGGAAAGRQPSGTGAGSAPGREHGRHEFGVEESGVRQP